MSAFSHLRYRLSGLFIAVFVVIVSTFGSTAFAAAQLGVHFDGDQAGTVTSSDGLINCPGACDVSYASGTTTVTLTASTVPGRPVSWGGVTCNEGYNGQTCTYTVPDGHYDVADVLYNWSAYNGTVKFEGSGAGTVTSSVGGMNCSTNCTEGAIPMGGSFSITATPAAGSVFGGWDGPSNGASDCFSTVGKGGEFSGINPNTTCYLGYAAGSSKNLFTAVPIFNKAPTVSAAPVGTPGSSSPSSIKSTAKAATPAPSTPAVSTQATPNLSVDGVKVGGNSDSIKVGADTATTVTLPLNKPLVLSGKTIPNGIVNLTIHSTLRTATVTADANGNWAYTITGLEAGQHHVAATVTDPVTKQTSASVTLAAFTVAAKPVSNTTATTTASNFNKSSLVATSVVGILILALAVASFWWFKHRKTTLA